MDYFSVNSFKFGCFSKCEGVNYLSDAEFRAGTTPGPETYFEKDDYEVTVTNRAKKTQRQRSFMVSTNGSSQMKRAGSNVSLKVPNKGLSKSWRFKKTDLPAPGTYDISTASTHQSIMRSEPKYKFSNS